MSADAMVWAWKQTNIRPSDKIVLLSLADRSNDSFMCWPGIERLALDTCLNKETVILAIDRLVDAGLVKKQKRFGKSTIYTLIGVFDRHSIPETRNSGNPDSSIPETPTQVFRKPGKESLIEPNNITSNKSAPAPQKIRMTLEWHPTQDEINAHCARSAKSPSLITPTVLQEFREYWSEEQSYFTHAQWITKLLQSAQRQKATPYAGLKKIVAPIPPNPDKPSDWAVQFCAELEEEKKRDAERSGRCNVQA